MDGTEPEAGTATVRHRSLRIGVYALAGIVFLTAAGWLVYYRTAFGTFAFWHVPPRISYCGRDYDQGSIIAALPTQGYTFTEVMTLEPAGWHVYSKNPTNVTIAPVAGLPCTMGLVLKHNDHQFVQYGLSGGP